MQCQSEEYNLNPFNLKGRSDWFTFILKGNKINFSSTVPGVRILIQFIFHCEMFNIIKLYQEECREVIFKPNFNCKHSFLIYFKPKT